MFSKKTVSRSGTFAGLALHGDSLRYVELSGRNFRVLRQEFVPLAPGGVVKDNLKDINAVGATFESLRATLGKFSCPVVLGLPARDVTVRVIEYPKTPMEELRNVIALEFEKHFAYPWSEAAADIAEVETPALDAAAKTTVLVATCELEKMKMFFRAAVRSGMQLCAVEPMNTALFRAVAGPSVRSGAYLVVAVEPEVTHIMMGYKDNGILFRSAAVDLVTPEARNSDEGLMPILRDVQNTLIFAGNQYRGLEIKDLILCGSIGDNPRLKVLLEAGASINVSVLDVWNTWQTVSPLGNVSGYGTAFGLALRNLI